MQQSSAGPPGPAPGPNERDDSGRRRRRRSRRTPDEPCLNCGDTTPGNYCPNCGQAKRDVTVSVGALIADVLEDQLILSRALPRTLFGLLFRPGLLTTEYIRGRIVRYIAPFRLYLVTSVVFFLLLSVLGPRLGELNVEGDITDLRALADSTARMALAQGADSAVIAELLSGFEALDENDLATAYSIFASLDSVAAERGAGRPLQPWARDFNISFTADEETDALGARVERRVLERFGHMPINEALRAFLSEYVQYVPHTMFVLLPLFALVLKLLYIRRRRYYAEHFIFALHVHAFIFLMFILMLLLDWAPIRLALLGWIMVYFWLALRRVYRQGVIRTTLKYFVMGFVYNFLLVIGLAATFIVTLLLL